MDGWTGGVVLTLALWIGAIIGYIALVVAAWKAMIAHERISAALWEMASALREVARAIAENQKPKT